ncbi:MAG: glycoside hydrolase family 3 N-terminal domain-containing protein, partial [Rikenellaceae bacterium]
MKLLRLLTLTLLVGCSEPHDLYRDPSKSTDRRVENLLSQMTLEEKLQQLNQMVMGKDQNVNNLTTDRENNPLSPMTGSFIYFNDKPEVANALQRRAIEESRLGIPVLLGHDVIHGYRTLFPMPLAQACSWNTDLVYQSSRVAARESYLSGLRWTFSPMLDVARDGRWGRVAESYGEDPYANSRFAEAVVKGYQGERLDDKYSIAACAKHFAGYAYSQGGRDYHPTDISDLSLWETVLPPYQAAVDAGVATIMSSFNDLNGTPTVASKGLLTKILRKRLGFKGFVVSDWRAIEQLLTQRFAADSLDAAVKAITAGNDMDMYDMLYCNYLPRAVKEGIIDEEIIDEAVRRVLTVKFNLGLFDNPYTEVIEAEKRYMLPEDRALAHTLAQESMVLLKNENSTLPISTDVKRILLVGAMSKDRLNMMGTWRSHAQASDVVTILDGLKSEFEGRATIEYLDGASIEKNREGLLKELTLRAPKADMVIVALGEKNSWSGENGSKASLSLPAPQQRL